MMEINNKHIVLMLLVIIIGVFIYNYDVYVIPKNEPLCKPVYITKRELTPEIRAELNKTESEILKETFGNLAEIEYFESFGNLDSNSSESSSYDVPPKSFSTFTIPSLTNPHKIKVIDSVIKILSYIPTNYCEDQIKQMVEYFGIIYETSPNLETFYKNIASSTKIKQSPYNSKYSHLILFLIGKFDDDYLSCPKPQSPDLKCAMNELLKEIIEKTSNETNNNQNNQNEQNKQNEENEQNDELIVDEKIYPEYLEEEISNAIESESNFNPKQVLNIIEKTKGKNSQNKKKSDDNVILPKVAEKNLNLTKAEISSDKNNYLNDQYPSNSNVPNYLNSNKTKYNGMKSRPENTKSKNTKCNGAKCTYKCDSSYSNAISYLDSELKPMESFGNILDNYASF